MISNLLLLATAIYIYVDAMRTLKSFISSKILHLCLYSLGHQFHMLDLLQLQEPGLNYICYRNLADKVFLASENFLLGQMSAGIKLIKSCSTLHSLTTSIVSACDILVQTQGLCGHPTKTCLSGNVK